MSLINIGELSKPATVLIEKVSDAIGVLWHPHQIEREARAEAKAAIITTNAGIEISDLQRRALQRVLAEESQRQSNMESVLQKSIPLLTDKAKPKEIENDWFTNFFEKSRLVSDEEMQLLWARILAGEANNPGSFSKKTISLLADLDKNDAELFSNLLRFCWIIDGELIPLILDTKAEIYKKQGITFSPLQHLGALGLINHIPVGGLALNHLPSEIKVSYASHSLELAFKNDKGNNSNSVITGQASLTKAGFAIASIAQSPPVEGFFEYIHSEWIEQFFDIKSEVASQTAQ